ncbi:MAG: ATP synthase F1 subunit gamma [Coprococcus sp.]
MASMREIKRRKASIQSTAQTTKAMKLVSTVKFQKARVKAETTRPYSDKMYETVSSILSKSGNIHHRYLMQGESGKKAVIVITSNRGLAGGYNSNVEKAVMGAGFNPADVQLYTVGRKGRDSLVKKGYVLAKDYGEVIEAPTYRAAMDIGRDVLEAFSAGEVGEIWIAYTVFKNTITHVPKMIRLLPVAMPEEDVSDEKKGNSLLLMNFEPEPEEVLDAVIPKYINSVIYGAMMNAVASENGARMTAMDNATSNAEEMIEDLTLSYNRARQGAITQEITEIVSGAEALK